MAIMDPPDIDTKETLILLLEETRDLSKRLQHIELIEPTQNAFRVRVGQFQNEVRATLSQHTQTLAQHSQILSQHTQTLEQHSQILDQHTQTLAQHSQILDQHTQTLAHIVNQLDANAQTLAELRDEVKELRQQS